MSRSTISIEDVASWFLAKESMTPKKLQKICYYAVAWGWALMDRNITNDGKFEAWVHGPVSQVLYTKYRRYGWNDIPKRTRVPAVPSDVNELLEAVWFTYGAKSGNELEALSHSERPWVEARNGLAPNEISRNVIKSDVMKSFYNSIKSADF